MSAAQRPLNRPAAPTSASDAATTTTTRPTSRGTATAAVSTTSPLQRRPAPVIANNTTSAITNNLSRDQSTSFNDLDYATQQRIMRAVHVLGNSGLLMKYALENDVSIPQTRYYFEQVAAGGNPKPVIKKWFPF